MKQLQVFALVAVALVVSGAGFYILNDDDSISHQVWDCTFQDSDVCVESEINEYQNCQNEDGEPDIDACRTTSEGIEEITMYTDSGNYINSPITEEDYRVESVGFGQNNAWDAEFLEDGRLLYTEMEGKLVKVDGEEKIEEAELEGTQKFGNTGLLGVAADPEFEENNYVYLYYFAEDLQRNVEHDVEHMLDPIYNRVSRFEFVDGELRNEKILIDEIEGSSGHSGGRIDIGPDGYLYVTTGDSEYAKTEISELHQRIQDRDFLGGKVLRTTLEGEVPETNPYDDSYVFAEGFRNPQGIDFHPETGEPFISMHGPWRHDEVNLVESGRNYGWPGMKCDREHFDVEIDENVEPTYCFDDWTIAPSGVAFVDDPEHEWYGDYFVTGLRGSMIYRIQLDSDMSLEHSEVFYIRQTEVIDNRLRNVEFNGDSLYLFGDGHGVGRITPE